MISLVCYGRPVIGPPTPGPVTTPALIPATVPNNDFFQEFMWTCIERVRAQALAALATPAPDVEVTNDTDRPLKPRNSDLYYGNLHIECYYFY